MTASIYQQVHMVQLTPDGEWLVAVPHPLKSHEPQNSADPIWAVDVDKNLAFRETRAASTLTAMKAVPALNRFVPITLELIPDMLEASTFSLLNNLLFQVVEYWQQTEATPRNRLILLTLQSIFSALGQGLQQALTQEPERVETDFARHDFLVYRLQARMRQAGLAAHSWPPEEEEE